ncbi:MAG: hypothetical protein DRQ60_03455 [Gammaproteobacteria bacterium]|nr:MAG: hypothetical protein DRQ54_05415 [Gammaproteobacteria bacterium]RLA14770.1 MAG: hypothetical protein DRQ52_03410 [Gammaproteobacteria bacterium]RLA16868.1 MAG: hypothetical protein DRQ60_03455 [Gammaproteobacteria bacterium]
MINQVSPTHKVEPSLNGDAHNGKAGGFKPAFIADDTRLDPVIRLPDRSTQYADYLMSQIQRRPGNLNANCYELLPERFQTRIALTAPLPEINSAPCSRLKSSLLDNLTISKKQQLEPPSQSSPMREELPALNRRIPDPAVFLTTRDCLADALANHLG